MEIQAPYDIHIHAQSRGSSTRVMVNWRSVVRMLALWLNRRPVDLMSLYSFDPVVYDTIARQLWDEYSTKIDENLASIQRSREVTARLREETRAIIATLQAEQRCGSGLIEHVRCS